MAKTMKWTKAMKTARFGILAIAQILLLRSKGMSYPDIAKTPLVRKKRKTGEPAGKWSLRARSRRDPSSVLNVCPQAIAYQCKAKKLNKRKGTFVSAQGQGQGGGRPRKVTDGMRDKIVAEVKKHQFARVRAPRVRRKLSRRRSTRKRK